MDNTEIKPNEYNLYQRLGKILFQNKKEPYPRYFWGLITATSDRDPDPEHSGQYLPRVCEPGTVWVRVSGATDSSEYLAYLQPYLQNVVIGARVLVLQVNKTESFVIRVAQDESVYSKDYMSLMGIYEGEKIENVLKLHRQSYISVDEALNHLEYSRYRDLHPGDYTYFRVNGEITKFIFLGFTKKKEIVLCGSVKNRSAEKQDFSLKCNRINMRNEVIYSPIKAPKNPFYLYFGGEPWLKKKEPKQAIAIE